MRRWTQRLLIAAGALILLSCIGCGLPGELVVMLAVGWVFFLVRVGPQITPNWGAVGLTLGALAVFTDGLHLFLRWLYGQTHPRPQGADPRAAPRWRFRWSLALVAVVVLMFVAGIAATGVVHQAGWLVTSKEPMFENEGGSRTAARRSQSINNLKQIGLGLHNYQATFATFPAGATADRFGELFHSWQTALLPYIEQPALYKQIDQTRPWDDLRNAPIFETQVNAYLNPGIPILRDDDGPAPSHYAGNARMLGGLDPKTLAAIKDGTANTIMAGEVARDFKPWGQPGNWRDPALGVNQSPAGFGGPYHGGANFLMADGSIKFIKNTVAPHVMKALSTPAGGEPIAPEDY